MIRLSGQGIVIACALLAGAASYWVVAERSATRVPDAGFWFEDVTFASPRLGAPITIAEIRTIARVARSELAKAFRGLPITLTDRRGARYRIRVVRALRDHRFRRDVGVAGESRAVSGFGGQGAVSFTFLASGAVEYAPNDADRASMIEAIGRGIGRTAVLISDDRS